jgi:hypothetical protein
MRKRSHWPIFVGAGAIETIAGGARAEDCLTRWATLSASNALYATYLPANQATLSSVMEARRRGRMNVRK